MDKKYRFLLISVSLIAILCLGKVLYLQTIRRDFLLTKAEKQRATPLTIEAKRGDIKSSDGSILATSVPTYNVYSDNRYIKDTDEAARIVADFFELDTKEVIDKINSNYYVELVKGVSKEDIDEFIKVKPKGISYYKTTTRAYPSNSLLGSVLGFVGNDGDGLAGLELSLNSYLKGIDGVNNSERDKNGNPIAYNAKDIINPIDGDDVTLTINYDIQYQMEKEIKEAVETYSAKQGIAISMNPKTGELLGLAQYPTLDPNNYKEYDQELYKSLALGMTYEPGSTFKPITVAIADATNSVDIENDVFIDGGSYYIGKHRIGNWGSRAFGAQTAREILMNSSNVGTVQIAFKIPPNEFYNYLKKFGFGTKTKIEIPGENNSIMFSEEQLQKDINRATNSFGQGIAVTPLQLMKAWCILINGGHTIEPHILKESINQNGDITYSNKEKINNSNQVIPETTSEKVKKMLQAVVDEGTGKKVRIAGYSVGGKTGTAQMVENGKYLSGQYRVSFVGFAPVEDPEILTLVLLDSPASSNASGGGMCAPAVKNILEYSLSKLGIQPTFGETVVSNDNNIITDEYNIEDVVEDVDGTEVSTMNYKYRLTSYLKTHKPSIPYEVEGDGDIIIAQDYVSTEDGVKVVFTTDNMIKDDYIIMPDLSDMTYNEFIGEFKEHSDKIILNGNKKEAVTVQDNKKGSHINIATDKIVLWSK